MVKLGGGKPRARGRLPHTLVCETAHCEWRIVLAPWAQTVSLDDVAGSRELAGSLRVVGMGIGRGPAGNRVARLPMDTSPARGHGQRLREDEIYFSGCSDEKFPVRCPRDWLGRSGYLKVECSARRHRDSHWANVEQFACLCGRSASRAGHRGQAGPSLQPVRFSKSSELPWNPRPTSATKWPPPRRL
jgi:hypothetical protein